MCIEQVLNTTRRLHLAHQGEQQGEQPRTSDCPASERRVESMCRIDVGTTCVIRSREHMTHSCNKFAFLFAVASLLGPSWNTRGDMVETLDGTLHVGRILSEADDMIRLKTGSDSGRRILKLPRDRIAKVIKAAEEYGRIDACDNVASLDSWSAGYFHAEELPLATRCIKRLLSLGASLGEAPKHSSASDYCLFWNRLVFRERTASLAEPSFAELLEHAEWAHTAGLSEETSRFLCRAQGQDPRSKRITHLAKKWGVSLEPRLRLVLTPAIERTLITQEIMDHNERVFAKKGKFWLTLPLRYDSNAPPMIFSKDMIHGRDARGFYGVRAFRVYGESPQFALADEHPIYERIDLEKGDSGRPRLSARNTLGPRRVQREDNQLKQPRLSARPSELPAAGWIAIVLEIPDSAKQISFEWEHGGKETIDLGFLRHLHERLPDRILRNPSSPRIAEILAKVQGPSAPMAALAIEQLRLLKEQMRSNFPKAWTKVVDRIVLEAVARGDSDVRSAALDYVLSYAGIPPATAEHVAALGRADLVLASPW